MVAYNMINQCAEREVFPLCRKNDVGTTVVFAVRKTFNRPERLKQVIKGLKRRELIAPDAVSDEDPLGWLVKGDVHSPISAAYRFCASNEDVSTVMTGTINMDHLEENVQCILAGPLPQEDWSGLDSSSET